MIECGHVAPARHATQAHRSIFKAIGGLGRQVTPPNAGFARGQNLGTGHCPRRRLPLPVRAAPAGLDAIPAVPTTWHPTARRPTSSCWCGSQGFRPSCKRPARPPPRRRAYMPPVRSHGHTFPPTGPGERARGGTPGKATANMDKDGRGQSGVKSRGPLAIRIELPVIEDLGIKLYGNLRPSYPRWSPMPGTPMPTG